MKDRDEEQLILSYLLGDLADAERTRVEERYFTDPSFLDLVESVEDDLIDSYARGELSSRERQNFEKHFLTSPRRQDRVAVAEALQVKVAAARRPATVRQESRDWRGFLFSLFRLENLATRVAFATVLVITLGAVSWLWVQNSRLRAHLQQAQIEQDRARQEQRQLEGQLAEQREQNQALVEELSKQPDSADPTTAPPTPDPTTDAKPFIASFILVPGLTREVASLRKLEIPAAAQAVRLQLVLDVPGEYASYRAALQKPGGAEIWSRQVAKTRQTKSGKTVAVALPASLLDNGDYLLTLTGTTAAGASEVIGDYPFAVVRK